MTINYAHVYDGAAVAVSELPRSIRAKRTTARHGEK